MRRTLCLLLIPALTVVLAPAQEVTYPKEQTPVEPKPDPAMLRLRDKVNPEYQPWSPAQVFERAAEFTGTVREGMVRAGAKEDYIQRELRYIRFFDASGIPRTLMPALTSAFFFGANSAARIPVTIQPKPVPGTDNRLYWVNLCWYNWSIDAWENIAKEDPYFREPIIPSDALGLNFVRGQTQANAIIRADWWLWYVFDNGEFVNQKGAEDFNPNAFYYQLLYGNTSFERRKVIKVKKLVEEKKIVKQKWPGGKDNGKFYPAGTYDVEKTVKVEKEVEEVQVEKVKNQAPKTAADFEALWHVDFNVLKEFPIDKGMVVDEGFSNVSYSNRIVWRVRSSLGTYYRTFDVFRSAGDQDFIESPFPKKFNAGEHIFQDERGAQYYALSNGEGNMIDYANPFVVKGDPAGPHHTVLVTSKSCMHCHDVGILKGRNELPVLKRSGVDILAYDPGRAARIEQFYLQEKKFNRLIDGDQENYANFVKDCNGLTTSENLQNFQKIRAWYMKPVTLAQGARELGVDPLDLEHALFIGAGTPDHPAGVTKGRLGRLILDGHPIPRHTWERGSYAEAGLLLREWVKNGKMRPGKEAKPG